MSLIIKFISAIILIAVLLFLYFNLPVNKGYEEAAIGLTFSNRYSSDIGLDWRQNFTAILDDLGAKKIRIPVYWDLVEKEEGRLDFSEVDWQLREAAKRQAEIILVVGQKVPRWPECAIPEWAAASDEKRKESLLRFVEQVVERYKDEAVIKYWQVENEPFLLFGVCPRPDGDLLDKEIELVRSLDPSRKIIITDSGELSVWVPAARRADIFGTTMYRNVYSERFGYFKYPIGPRFFHLKYAIINMLAGQENAIVVELQAEPWIKGYTTNQPLEEQFKSMTAEQIKENVTFAKQAGFPQIYLWGAEWWYWLKVEKDHPEEWDTLKEYFNN